MSKPSERFAMTKQQEIANAFTMVTPAIYLIKFVIEKYQIQESHPMVFVVMIGTLMHLPISFTYHLCVGYGRYRDRLDNDMRRLDQSMQLVVGTMFAFALSGSIWYTMTVMVINLNGLFLLWSDKTSNDGKRWFSVMVCICLYIAPMLVRNDFENFYPAFASMVLGGTAFIPEKNKSWFGGWGHTLFHISLWYFSKALAASACQVEYFHGFGGEKHTVSPSV